MADSREPLDESQLPPISVNTRINSSPRKFVVVTVIHPLTTGSSFFGAASRCNSVIDRGLGWRRIGCAGAPSAVGDAVSSGRCRSLVVSEAASVRRRQTLSVAAHSRTAARGEFLVGLGLAETGAHGGPAQPPLPTGAAAGCGGPNGRRLRAGRPSELSDDEASGGRLP